MTWREGTSQWAAELACAIEALEAGQAVVFPTDTVYGVGVSVRHTSSPQVIFDVKQRDQDKPVAWLVGSPDALREFGREVPPEALELAQAHWPGALTIIVKASQAVPPAFQSAEGTIGLRMPANATALALVKAAGPLATSSANISGDRAPRDYADLDSRLLAEVPVALRGNMPGSGLASTVIDCSQRSIRVVRQGDITCGNPSGESPRPKEVLMSGEIYTVPFSYASNDGKSTVSAKLWTTMDFGSPDEPGEATPKGVIQIIHGMAEYIDRYDDLARYMVERGFVVCAEDHIGHGATASSPEEYGHMPINGGKDILLSDVHALYEKVHECFPGVPYIMYGHSMGSFIARCYIARYGDDLAACVLTGTGNVPAEMSKLGRTLARTLARMRGETYRSKLIDNMGAGAYGKQIENARTDLDWLSTDEAVVDAYIEDEKCGFMFTVGGYATLLDLTAECVTPECAAQVPKTLPILLASGDKDPVGDMGEGVRAAAQLLRFAGVRLVQLKLYPDMRHEIHNEKDHEQVYDDIVSWVEKVLAED